MPIYHQKTEHSYMSIRKNSFFLDWRTQPKNYKTYPHFQQRIKIEDFEELNDLNLIGGITYEKEYPEGKYYLRTNPSAGALYPCEIYIQIRGIKGLIPGIYHYEPHTASLCLLQECESDGVEYYFKDNSRQKGFVFLISSIYFRSSWKYRDRSIRYILLDSGHALGAIYAALCVMGKETTFEFDFDKLALNEKCGFRADEMFICSAIAAQKLEKETKPLRQELPFVSGCDFLETNKFIEEAYTKTANYESTPLNNLGFFNDIPKEQLKNTILNRRSIRAFRMQNISQEEYHFILKDLFNFAIKNSIDIFYTLHRVDGEIQGLYKNGTLVSEGDFSQKSRYLSLEQNLGGQSALTFYFTSNDKQAYQKVNILSGFIAHLIYLRSELKQIGCSGIGAYYDKEVQEFLRTENNILYLLAIGR